MHRINHITSGMDAELQALLDLHAAQTFKEFWRAARRVIHSALPVGTTWFAPASDWLLPTAAFRAEMPFQAELEFRRFQERHPLGAFLRANPKKALARLSDHLPDLRLRKSDFYREFMPPQHERLSVVLALWQPRVATRIDRAESVEKWPRPFASRATDIGKSRGAGVGSMCRGIFACGANRRDARTTDGRRGRPRHCTIKGAAPATCQRAL